jgi:hypothetical protein
MNRYLAKPRRSEIGYKTFKRDKTEWFILSHSQITASSNLRGIWQIGLARFVRAQKVFIFFTCPHCGEIQRDLAESPILERARKFHATHSTPTEESAIRWCHRCRFCRRPVPYTLDDPTAAFKEYKALEKELKAAKEVRKIKVSTKEIG